MSNVGEFIDVSGDHLQEGKAINNVNFGCNEAIEAITYLWLHISTVPSDRILLNKESPNLFPSASLIQSKYKVMI